MNRYIALIDGHDGAYGVVIPDLPGCTAMGETVDGALMNAVEAMRDWAEVVRETGGSVPAPRPMDQVRADVDVADALAEGAMLATVALVQHAGKPVKANLSLDAGVLSVLDAEARRRGLTRSAMVEVMTKQLAAGAA